MWQRWDSPSRRIAVDPGVSTFSNANLSVKCYRVISNSFSPCFRLSLSSWLRLESVNFGPSFCVLSLASRIIRILIILGLTNRCHTPLR
ncbi:hypothetical protein Q3G72_031774 [Acer saccharum]|nr:hypothetical protein Q3G72_031774 [Acer saccharum]